MNTSTPPSQSVLVWAGGVLVSFFLPWFQLFGHGISGYQIGSLGSYGNYAWIIPILAVGTILLTFARQNNRIVGAFTGLVPIGVLIYAIGRVAAEGGGRATEQVLQVAEQVFSIGAYLTILCSLALLVSASRPAPALPSTSPPQA